MYSPLVILVRSTCSILILSTIIDSLSLFHYHIETSGLPPMKAEQSQVEEGLIHFLFIIIINKIPLIGLLLDNGIHASKAK